MVGPASEAYRRGAEAVFHAILGSAAVAGLVLLGVNISIIDCVVVAALYSLKEFTDRANGGSVGDCIEDTLAVFIGAILYANPVMPIGVLILGVTVMLLRIGNVD